MSTQLDSADAGPRSYNKAPYNSPLDALGRCFCSFPEKISRLFSLGSGLCGAYNDVLWHDSRP